MGQHGNGTLASSPVPQDVKSVPDFRLASVAAGGSHSCGIDPYGMVYCWGAGQFGQLGNGGRTLSGNPASAGLTLFDELLVGNSHSCGVSRGRTALCWGLNVFGQLGTGDFAYRTAPAPVAGGLAFVRSGG